MSIDRTAASLLATLLLLTACGGGDESSTSDPATDGSSSGAAAGSGETATITFDAAALPTSPLDPGLVTVVNADAAGALEPVVDPCEVLDASTVDEIVGAHDDLERDFGFTATNDGSTCTYVFEDAFVIAVAVNSADVLTEDYVRRLNGFVSPDEVVVRPAPTDPEVEQYLDDAGGIETMYAARFERGPWAAVAVNAAGTGLMIGDDEREAGWTELAVAAVEGAEASGVTPEVADEPAGVPADLCAVYEPTDLEAAFGVPFVEDAGNGPMCTWSGGDLYVTVTADLATHTPESMLLQGEPTDGVWIQGGTDNAVWFGDGFNVAVAVRHYELDTDPFRAELIANLRSRLGG